MVAIDHRNDTFIAGFERSSMRDKGGGVARRLCGRSHLAPLMAFKQVHIILLDWANRISYAHTCYGRYRASTCEHDTNPALDEVIVAGLELSIVPGSCQVFFFLCSQSPRNTYYIGVVHIITVAVRLGLINMCSIEHF